MDPNATLRDLRAALAAAMNQHHHAATRAQARHDACEHTENLLEWLDRGGFLPDAWQPFTAAAPADNYAAASDLAFRDRYRRYRVNNTHLAANDDDVDHLVAVQSDRDALAIIQLRGDVEQLEKEAAARIETTRVYRLELQRYAELLDRARREAENAANAAQEWERIARHYSSHLAAIATAVNEARINPTDDFVSVEQSDVAHLVDSQEPTR
jgi:hypothetical protein